MRKMPVHRATHIWALGRSGLRAALLRVTDSQGSGVPSTVFHSRMLILAIKFSADPDQIPDAFTDLRNIFRLVLADRSPHSSDHDTNREGPPSDKNGHPLSPVLHLRCIRALSRVHVTAMHLGCRDAPSERLRVSLEKKGLRRLFPPWSILLLFGWAIGHFTRRHAS